MSNRKSKSIWIVHERGAMPGTDSYEAFSSLRALSNGTGIPYSTLLYNFSKKKVRQYVREEGMLITKSALYSSERKP